MYVSMYVVRSGPLGSVHNSLERETSVGGPPKSDLSTLDQGPGLDWIVVVLPSMVSPDSSTVILADRTSSSILHLRSSLDTDQVLGLGPVKKPRMRMLRRWYVSTCRRGQ